MNLLELNQVISQLNPYAENDKALLRFYLKARRKLIKELTTSINQHLSATQ